MAMQAAEPDFDIGQRVLYVDRHGRPQEGRILWIRAHWRSASWPQIIYTVDHPSYQNRRFCTDDVTAA